MLVSHARMLKASMPKDPGIWDNRNNAFSFRVGLMFTGEIPTRLNLETQEEEYYLHLDFVNTDGWFTQKFIRNEWNLRNEATWNNNKNNSK